MQTKLDLAVGGHPVILMDELLAHLSENREYLYQLRKAGNFPEPVIIGSKLLAWRKSDIAAWERGYRSNHPKGIRRVQSLAS